jgi:23S rRNA (cytidine1920-2'-O)/16S rRNA (cytidine1409-2'-O)-methyltransferase
MERTNFRYVTPVDLTFGMPEFASIDVSFISLKLILPVLKTLLVPDSDVVALVKPQFEAGRDQVGKKGIVREPKIHEAVLEMIRDFSLKEGYDVQDLSFSPITGGEGNIEFLLHLKWCGPKDAGLDHLKYTISQVVAEAHQQLKAEKGE